MDNRIDIFMAELKDRLKGKVSRRSQAEILAEARTHLEDEAAELTTQGMPREEAEEIALQRFGAVDQVKDWYLSAHRLPSIWRAALWPLVVLIAYVILTRYLPIFMLPGYVSSMVFYINFTLLLMIWACYRAKRSTLVLTGPAIALYAVGYFIYFSAFCIPKPGEHGYGIVTRGSVEQHIQESRDDLKKAESTLAMLQQGRQVFQTEYEPVQVPPEFRTDNGYATPMYFQMRDFPILTVYLDGVPTKGMMTSWSEAREFWVDETSSLDPITHKEEPHYIASTDSRILANRRVIAELPALAKTTWRDHVSFYARVAAMNAFLPLYFAIAGDAFGALIRWARRTWRSRRGRRRGIA